MNNAIESINNRIDQTKEKIFKLEDKILKLPTKGETNKKKWKRMKKVHEIYKTSQKTKMHILLEFHNKKRWGRGQKAYLKN